MRTSAQVVQPPVCSIERSLGILGERWTFLILREAFFGSTRFAQFRSALGIAPDVLTDRLATLVAGGVLEKRPYQESGARARESYHLTAAGRDLRVVLGALQQWGDEHLPLERGPSVLTLTAEGAPLTVGFIDRGGAAYASEQVVFQRTQGALGDAG